MAQDTDQIKILANGDVYVAPVGTTTPADATTALPSAWKKLGYMTEDGPGATPGLETGDVRGWQSAYALRRFVTSRSLELSFTMLQVWEESVKLAFGGGTVTGTSPDYTYTPPDPEDTDDRAVVLEGIDGSVKFRLCIPRATVSTVGQIQFQRGAAANIPVTMQAIGEAGQKIMLLRVADAQFSATGG